MNEENILRSSFRKINSNYVLLLVYLLVTLVPLLSRHFYVESDSKITTFIIRFAGICMIAYIHCGVLALFYQSLRGTEVNLRMLPTFANRYLRLYVLGMIGFFVFSCLFFSPFFFFVSRVKFGTTGYVFESPRTYLVVMQGIIFILSVFMMYTTAFIFSKNRGISAVVDAIKYLLMNFKKSIPLLTFNLMGWIIVSAILVSAVQFPEGCKRYSFIVFFSRMLTNYISLTIYIGACFVLMSETSERP